MFHWQNIVSRNETKELDIGFPTRSIHSALHVQDTDDIKQKNKSHETIPSIFFPEKKTKKSFAFSHLCPVHENLIGIWKLLFGQTVTSFGQGKCTFDFQSGNFTNYASGNHVLTSSCMLRIEKLITFKHDLYVDISYKFTLAWVCVCHASTQIAMNTFINDLVLFTRVQC